MEKAMSTQKAFPESLSESPGKDLPGHAIPPSSGDNGLPGGSKISSDRLRVHLDHPVVHLIERLYVKSAVFTYKAARMVSEMF
jgi:hypothetical protein